MSKEEEKKKHRHKWIWDCCECPHCLTGEHAMCDCGETKDGPKN